MMIEKTLAKIVGSGNVIRNQAALDDYLAIRDSLPAWVLFYNLAAYEYLPEERISGQVQDAIDLAQRIGVDQVKAIGKTSCAGDREAPSKVVRIRGCQEL